jgi:hypothetical protein
MWFNLSWVYFWGLSKALSTKDCVNGIKQMNQQDMIASYIAKGGIQKWCIKTRKSRKLKNISSYSQKIKKNKNLQDNKKKLQETQGNLYKIHSKVPKLNPKQENALCISPPCCNNTTPVHFTKHNFKIHESFKNQNQTKLFPSSMLQLRLVLIFCDIKSTSHSIIENPRLASF